MVVFGHEFPYDIRALGWGRVEVACLRQIEKEKKRG